MRLIEHAIPHDLQETLQRVTYLETYWQVYGEGLCHGSCPIAALDRSPPNGFLKISVPFLPLGAPGCLDLGREARFFIRLES